MNHYFTARQTARTNYRHNDVLVYLTDEDSGVPISLGSVSVEELELSTDITPNGTFRFKSFPAGEYTLRIENIGYKTLLVPIRRYASEQSKLHLNMKAVPLAEPHPVE